MTTYFLVITIVVSLIAFQNSETFSKLIFNPYVIHTRKQWYRFFTSGLIHADYLHLAVNMFVLYSFGNAVEMYYSMAFADRGAALYVILYVSALMMSVIPTYNNHKENPGYNGLGASGAVSAVVFAYVIFDPIRPLWLFGIIKMPGILFGLLYLFYSYYMGKKGGDNINHSAHMWGAIYGLVFTIVMKPSLILDFFEKLTYFSDAF